ncbi:MAG TPA: hypothetical protein DDZ04_06250 [Parabacteroides sp.]|nr:hypothetical protein [Parabacteroides sp.]
MVCPYSLLKRKRAHPFEQTEATIFCNGSNYFPKRPKPFSSFIEGTMAKAPLKRNAGPYSPI